MLSLELEECEEILEEMEEDVEDIMYELDLSYEDAQKMQRVKEIVKSANKQKEMFLCV